MSKHKPEETSIVPIKKRRLLPKLDSSSIETVDHKGLVATLDFLQAKQRTHNELDAISKWLHEYQIRRKAQILQECAEAAFINGMCIPIRFLSFEKEKCTGLMFSVRETGRVQVVSDQRASFIFVPIDSVLEWDTTPIPFPIQPKIQTQRINESILVATGQVVWIRAFREEQKYGRLGLTTLFAPITGVLMNGLGLPEKDWCDTVLVQPCGEIPREWWGLRHVPRDYWSVVEHKDVATRVDSILADRMNSSLRNLIVDYAFDPPVRKPKVHKNATLGRILQSMTTD